MALKKETLAYLGPEGSFTHQAALDIQASNAQYGAMDLSAGLSIENVCEMVVNRGAYSAVTPIENSTDGSVPDALDAFRRHPLKIKGEYVYPIRQSLYIPVGLNPQDIRIVISKDSANGQVINTVSNILPNAKFENRNSTVAAILEAADINNRHMAAVGPRIGAKVQGLEDRFTRIDNVHDNPLNATRFLVVDCEDRENPVTGNDKTSMIVQMSDRLGSLHTALNIITNEGINLAKIKSFGSDGKDVAFWMTLQGHQKELPIDKAIRQLSAHDMSVKMLGSYPQAEYQPDEISPDEAIKCSIDRLKRENPNGIHQDKRTVVVFTLKDEVGALTGALEPFKNRGINLTNIDSLPTSRLGEYGFLVVFNNSVNQRAQALEELKVKCQKVVLL